VLSSDIYRNCKIAKKGEKTKIGKDRKRTSNRNYKKKNITRMVNKKKQIKI
jgi:hypothetical protein